MIQMIIVLSVPNASLNSEGLPPMPLDLSKFENPITLVEPGSNTFVYHNYYNKVLNGYGLSATDNQNLTDTMLTLVSKKLRVNAYNLYKIRIVLNYCLFDIYNGTDPFF